MSPPASVTSRPSQAPPVSWVSRPARLQHCTTAGCCSLGWIEIKLWWNDLEWLQCMVSQKIQLQQSLKLHYYSSTVFKMINSSLDKSYNYTRISPLCFTSQSDWDTAADCRDSEIQSCLFNVNIPVLIVSKLYYIRAWTSLESIFRDTLNIELTSVLLS